MNDLALQLRTRRRVRVGAIVAVLAVVVAIPFLRTDPETRLVSAPDLSTMRVRPMVYDVDFADARHGFALSARCVDRCVSKLLATEDGKTWVARPITVVPKWSSVRIVALGPGRVMITDAENRFYSNDSGLTWSPVPLAPNQTVETIPAGGVLGIACAEEVPVANSRPACLRRSLVVTLPDTGELALLARPPDLENPTPEVRAADDGSWWVSGKDAETGRWVVTTSRDAGRTWSSIQLPVPSGLVMNTLSGTGSGLNRYLLATGWLPDAMEPRNLVAIFRSTDGGAHWAQTWSGSGSAPRTVGGTAIVTADGGLLVAPDDVGPVYQSVDGGASFAPMLDGPRLTSVRRTGGGYLAAASDHSGQYLTSPDGLHWIPITLPA